MLTRVDAKTNQVTDSIEVGPQPRFLTFGAGAIWTLNQGDGTISRVDTKTHKLAATVEAGIPDREVKSLSALAASGPPSFRSRSRKSIPGRTKWSGNGSGPGGDSIRAAHGSVWLSNLRDHNIWRIDPKTL